MAYRQLGDHTAATRSWHRAMAIWRRIGDDWGAAHTLNNLGDIYRYKRRPDKAIACLRQALEILTRAGDTWGQARTLTNLGSSLGDLRRHEEAIGCLTQALRMRREITDQRGQAETLDRLAAVLVQTGAPAKARTAWRAALRIFQQLGDPQAETVQARLAATATGSPDATGGRQDLGTAGGFRGGRPPGRQILNGCAGVRRRLEAAGYAVEGSCGECAVTWRTGSPGR